VPTSAEIDRTLIKLETLAKARGLAVGVASALRSRSSGLPAWIKTLDSRGHHACAIDNGDAEIKIRLDDQPDDLRSGPLGRTPVRSTVPTRHDPEKWVPVFREIMLKQKDRAG